MSKKENLKTITDSRVYRLTTVLSSLYCPICSPNKGCNRKSNRWGEKWCGGWKDKKIKNQWERHSI